MDTNAELTCEQLKSLLHYDPATGVFTWLVDTFALTPIGASGFRGVTIKSRLPKPFVAQISIDNKKTHLGCFATGEEAERAYKDACDAHHVPIKGTVAGSQKSTGRWRIRIFYREYEAHRLAWLYMTGEWPSIEIDHKDTDPLNNRWENLRLATPSQNGANKRRSIANISGFKGVGQEKCGKHQATITVEGKAIYLGRFEDPADAHQAYLDAAKSHFGEFARGG